MADEPAMDRLTGQLYHLPAIIGRLGISIANAQKALNADYMKNVVTLMGLIERTLGSLEDDEDAKSRVEAIRGLLEALAPSRYQFTETTIDFSADLAETMDKTVSAGLGFGTQAITVNAAYTKGYGYDYRAAARITSVLHAYPLNGETAKSLLNRAADIQKDKLNMPQLSQVEKEVWDSTAAVFNSLVGDTGKEVKKVAAKEPTQDETE